LFFICCCELHSLDNDHRRSAFFFFFDAISTHFWPTAARIQYQHAHTATRVLS
jgi:hypothetical protein